MKTVRASSLQTLLALSLVFGCAPLHARIPNTPAPIGGSFELPAPCSATTYPGGQTLQYQRDATGQITALVWAGQPIVQGITWTPLGPPSSTL